MQRYPHWLKKKPLDDVQSSSLINRCENFRLSLFPPHVFCVVHQYRRLNELSRFRSSLSSISGKPSRLNFDRQISLRRYLLGNGGEYRQNRITPSRAQFSRWAMTCWANQPQQNTQCGATIRGNNAFTSIKRVMTQFRHGWRDLKFPLGFFGH